MIHTNIDIDDMLDLAASVIQNGADMSIGSQSYPNRTLSYKYFDIYNQKFVASGGASIIDFKYKEEAKDINAYIYGK